MALERGAVVGAGSRTSWCAAPCAAATCFARATAAAEPSPLQPPEVEMKIGSRRRRVGRAVGWLLLVVSLSALGCAKMPVPGRRPAEPAINESELRRELIGFASRFDSVVNDAATRIRFETNEPEYRQAALLWEMRVVPLVQEAVFAPNVKEAFWPSGP